MADPVSTVTRLFKFFGIFGGGSSKKKKRKAKAKAEADARRIADLERQLDKTKPRLPTTDVIPPGFNPLGERTVQTPPPKTPDQEPPKPQKAFVPPPVFLPGVLQTGEASAIIRVLGRAGLAGAAGLIIGSIGIGVFEAAKQLQKRVALRGKAISDRERLKQAKKIIDRDPARVRFRFRFRLAFFFLTATAAEDSEEVEQPFDRTDRICHVLLPHTTQLSHVSLCSGTSFYHSL
ncbi:unnamed protein product [marine sediment metagenome]|uniref:Uncharacterized protein n=1 Tax=marine sediment metagenome TaxID=412755 RepID=X0YRC4_9ZZZZ